MDKWISDVMHEKLSNMINLHLNLLYYFPRLSDAKVQLTKRTKFQTIEKLISSAWIESEIPCGGRVQCCVVSCI